jgi:hypothetical protein
MTRLELDDDSTAGDGAAHEQVRMPAGRIEVSVPKLGLGSLVVDTPNARVTVHGTRFSVEVIPATADWNAETRVAVVEGRVSVANGGREVFLEPGGRWSSSSSPAPAPAPSAASTPSAVPTPAPRPIPPAKSSLAVESDLFRSAVSARHAGDARQAIRILDQLLASYPASPLAAEARAERERAAADLKRAAP